MKILSYNVYGVKDTKSPIPKWDIRQKNVKRILNDLLKKTEIKVCCFQEVNENNISAINLYKKYRFEEVGRRKKYYDQKDDAILMNLKL